MKYIKDIDDTYKFSDLESKLLEIGGERVLHPRGIEEDLEKLLRRGESFDKKIQIIKMSQSQCHRNSADLYINISEDEGFDNVTIVTGYVLEDDNLWRQHSWIYLPMDDKIIETTHRRKKYFGFILDFDESEEFCMNNN